MSVWIVITYVSMDRDNISREQFKKHGTMLIT